MRREGDIEKLIESMAFSCHLNGFFYLLLDFHIASWYWYIDKPHT